MAMAKTDGSGPEQFRIHSSIVSKLLAFPTEVEIKEYVKLKILLLRLATDIENVSPVDTFNTFSILS